MLKCDRCSEKIKSPDSGDHYSTTFVIIEMIMVVLYYFTVVKNHVSYFLVMKFLV